MHTQNIIGPAIRRQRYAQQLSQEALAARCNLLGWSVSRGTISKIEAKIRRVNDAEIGLLAHALKISISDLFPAVGKKGIAEYVSVARSGVD